MPFTHRKCSNFCRQRRRMRNEEDSIVTQQTPSLKSIRKALEVAHGWGMLPVARRVSHHSGVFEFKSTLKTNRQGPSFFASFNTRSTRSARLHASNGSAVFGAITPEAGNHEAVARRDSSPFFPKATQFSRNGFRAVAANPSWARLPNLHCFRLTRVLVYPELDNAV